MKFIILVSNYIQNIYVTFSQNIFYKILNSNYIIIINVFKILQL